LNNVETHTERPRNFAVDLVTTTELLERSKWYFMGKQIINIATHFMLSIRCTSKL